MLECENPANQEWALGCFYQSDEANTAEGDIFVSVFDHGQIYIIAPETGETWSVNDAEDSRGNFYFDFERI